jgi:UDP-3-O-[3-hydroxymyristoyl] glucosamine N-acyltransferase
MLSRYSKENRMIRTTGEIAHLIGGELIGDGGLVVRGVASIEDAEEGDITFALNGRYLGSAYNSKATALIVSQDVDIEPKREMALIKVQNPRLAFTRVLELFAPKSTPKPGIHPTAFIGEGSKRGKDVSIGAYVVIGDDTRIGDGVILYPHVYIGDRVEIGEGSIIHPHVTIYRMSKIGKRVIIHSGSVVGSDGFGYVKVDGEHLKIPQNGSVEIGDDVEIGANVTIDRATTGTTQIGSGTKIDNLVMIAHNVSIGKNCVIVAQTAIAGSAKIEDGVTIAGQVGVAGHLVVGSNTVVAARSVITKSIKSGQFVSGFPARPHPEEKRIKVARTKLPDLLKKVKELEKKVERLEKGT